MAPGPGYCATFHLENDEKHPTIITHSVYWHVQGPPIKRLVAKAPIKKVKLLSQH